MSIRTPSWPVIVAVAGLSLGIGACTEPEQQRVEADARAAAESAQDAAAKAGEVLESGAIKAAQAIEKGSGDLARDLEKNQAEAASKGRPATADPASDEHVEKPASQPY